MYVKAVLGVSSLRAHDEGSLQRTVMAMHIARTLAQLEALAAITPAGSHVATTLTSQLFGMVGRWLLIATVAGAVVGLGSLAHWVFP